MRKVLAGLLATCALAGFGAGCFSEHQAATSVSGVCTIDLGEAFPGSTVVVIRSFTFQPTDVRIRVGERVTWVNCDPDAHTSTADDGAWGSPLLAEGDVFTQTFATAGEFPYHCAPHPFMVGRLIVE